MTCDKHKDHPVKIYGECVGCEIESLRGENQHLRQQVHELYAQIEVTPAPGEWHELRQQNEIMRKALDKGSERLSDMEFEGDEIKLDVYKLFNDESTAMYFCDKVQNSEFLMLDDGRWIVLYSGTFRNTKMELEE